MKISNDYSNSHSTNFKALQSIKWTGLYKKKPEYVKNLYDGLKKNETVMKFFEKYDTDVVFNAEKAGFSDLMESTLKIYYQDPKVNKFKNFLRKIFIGRPNIEINSFGYRCSLAESSQKLLESIVPGKKGKSILADEIKLIDKSI